MSKSGNSSKQSQAYLLKYSEKEAIKTLNLSKNDHEVDRLATNIRVTRSQKNKTFAENNNGLETHQATAKCISDQSKLESREIEKFELIYNDKRLSDEEKLDYIDANKKKSVNKKNKIPPVDYVDLQALQRIEESKEIEDNECFDELFRHCKEEFEMSKEKLKIKRGLSTALVKDDQGSDSSSDSDDKS